MRRVLTLLSSAVLVLGGCSLSGSDEPDPTAAPPPGSEPTPVTAWTEAKAADVRDGGTLRLAVEQLPTTFNPVHADAERSELDRVVGPTNGGAVRITGRGSWEVDPDYATSVEVVEQDPLQVRVRLNPEAVWQGGTPITARDMEAFADAMGGGDDYEVASSEGYDAIESVEQGEDEFDYTVTFEEPRSDWPLYVYPRLPANVSSDPEVFNDRFAEAPVSSNGPFVTTDVDPATGTITQERNPRWWGARPRLERVVWRVAALDVQAEAFEAEELEVATVDAQTIAAVGEDADLQRASGSQFTQLTLNAGRGPLEDRDVRRAVAMALDRDAVADATAEGLGVMPLTAGSLLQLPGQGGYRDAAAEAVPRDVEQARGLLEDAGYELVDGVAERDGEPVQLTLPVPEGSPSVEQRARQVAADLDAIGIAVEVTRVPAEDFTDDVLLPLDFDLVTFTWGPSLLGVQTAEQRFRPVDSPRNVTGVAEDGLDDAWDEARTELDADAHRDAVRTLDEELLDEAVMVPLSVVPEVMAVREGVVNYGAASFETPRWTSVGFRAEE